MDHWEPQRIARRRRTIALGGILLAGAMLLCSPCAFALDPSLDLSQYAHTAWKMRDGFIKGAITAIAQTPDGYLWLGTEFDLYRFDGVRAVLWQPPNGEQLPGHLIQNLLVARDGTLWIATDKGLASWKDGKLANYAEVAGQTVLRLLQDRRGTVWFGVITPGRLCAIQDGKVQCYGAGSFGRAIVALYQDHKGNLWVSAETGVWRWAPGPPEHYALPIGVIANALTENDDDTLLVASARGLKRLVRGKTQSHALPGVNTIFTPTCFFRSSDGRLWIGTQQGLLHVQERKTDTFRAADGLSGDAITAIFEDREGNVWIGTTGGLDRFREYTVPTISINQGLSNSFIWSVQATADGSIWIGAADGLNRWRDGRVTLFGRRAPPSQNGRRDERQLSVRRAVTDVTNAGFAGPLRSLGQDDQGRLWISTREGVFYLEAGRSVRVPGVPGGDIFGIVGDGRGNVWIDNSQLGLFHFKPGDTVQPIPIPWSQFGHKAYGARALLPDRVQGGLWLGFYESGIFYLQDGQVRSSYTAADGLGDGRINDLRFGPLGTLWVATENGLSRIKDGHIVTLTSKKGLPCDEVQWSIEDDDHFVWLYMPCGLARIAHSELDAWVSDPKRSVQTRILDSSDGVNSVGVPGSYGPRVTKSPDGKIWFAAWDGVSIIDPRHLPVNNLPPPVHIEQITADGKTYDASQGLKLPPLMRDLTIDYTALSFAVPEKVRFRVKLEGQDKDWREMANDRRVHYTNLAPKHYRFLVKACNNSGVWNEEGAFVDFAILPAYYQTNWFRALCVAAFMALLWCIYRIRVGVLEQRQQLLEQNQQLLERHRGEITALNDRLMKVLEEERTRIAGELHGSSRLPP